MPVWQPTEGLSDDDRRFFTDARDGLRHLRACSLAWPPWQRWPGD